jgi:hypothetical protein
MARKTHAICVKNETLGRAHLMPCLDDLLCIPDSLQNLLSHLTWREAWGLAAASKDFRKALKVIDGTHASGQDY